MPVGMAAVRRASPEEGSISAAKVSSAYSPVDEHPTGRASGKLTLAWGVNPCE